MPYRVFKRSGKWKVYKVDENDKPVGEALGTHETQEDAAAQIRAVHANEKKEMDDEMPMMAMGACSWEEMEAAEQAGEIHKNMQGMNERFQTMADNVMYNPTIEDKAAALADLAKGYQERMKKMPKMGMMRKALDAIGITKPELTPEAPDLFIWKSDDGVYRWLAAYSNNRRDDDDPPEIITSESHKEFDRALETSEWPMPEAWLWHVPYPVGVTQYHAYDESTGFPVAAGVFYKGSEWAAEGLIQAGWNGVSHGMPTTEIRRNDADPTIITRHRTKEISFLPAWAAANKLAFNIITKEVNEMEDRKGLPAHKRPEFEKAFGAERVAEIEATLEDKAKAADEAGIEKKEADTPLAGVQVEAETPEQPLTREEVVEALTAVAGPVKELAELVKGLKAEIDALKAGQEQAAKEKAEVTPAHSSLMAMLQARSVIGQPEAKVDERSRLAKDSGPEETKAQPLHAIPLIGNILEANSRYAGR